MSSTRSTPSMPPPSISNPFIQLALVTCHSGTGARVQSLLSSIRSHAESDSEPGCLTFRTSRGSTEAGEGDRFVVYEEYASREALQLHRLTEPFKALHGAGLIEKVEILVQNEFK